MDLSATLNKEEFLAQRPGNIKWIELTLKHQIGYVRGLIENEEKTLKRDVDLNDVKGLKLRRKPQTVKQKNF